MSTSADPEVQVLATIAGTLEGDYVKGGVDPWAGSPFAWIRATSSRQRGAIGEQLVAGWWAAKGFDVVRSRSSDADRIIHGHRVEVKFSTLWQSGGFEFQQIRDQQYDYLFCLGVTPWDAAAWLLPKSVLFDYVIGHTGQHTGAAGMDTAWLGFKAASPLPWLTPYGGTLAAVAGLLSDMPYGPHGAP